MVCDTVSQFYNTFMHFRNMNFMTGNHMNKNLFLFKKTTGYLYYFISKRCFVICSLVISFNEMLVCIYICTYIYIRCQILLHLIVCVRPSFVEFSLILNQSCMGFKQSLLENSVNNCLFLKGSYCMVNKHQVSKNNILSPAFDIENDIKCHFKTCFPKTGF